MREVAQLEPVFPEGIVAASNRAAMVYANGDTAALAWRLDGNARSRSFFGARDEAVARRDGAELRFTATSASGDAAILDHPDGRGAGMGRAREPERGELIVSATDGWEFADLAGRHHAGGGSLGRCSPATRRCRC